MAENDKNRIKSLAKMAKSRLKNGFWEDYKDNVEKQVIRAKKDGENASKVIMYYKEKAALSVGKKEAENEDFYLKVKEILDNYGEVSDMIARLCDENYLKTLDFVQRESYIFNIAGEYRSCKERYDKENRYNFLSANSGEREKAV